MMIVNMHEAKTAGLFAGMIMCRRCGISRPGCFSCRWKAEEFKELNFDDDRHIGIIAQEMEKVFPELVNTNEDGYKAVAYDKLTAVLLEAVKEQQDQIETLQKRIKRLEER